MSHFAAHYLVKTSKLCGRLSYLGCELTWEVKGDVCDLGWDRRFVRTLMLPSLAA